MRNPQLLVLDDGGLTHQVERVAAMLRPRPEVVSCENLDELDDALAATGFDLLVAGPPVASEEGLRSLRRFRLRFPETALILAFERRPGGSLRETVRTGALDILRLPVGDEALLESLEEALEIRWARRPEAPDAGPQRRTEGNVSVVVSANGGCGKTFFSANLAYHYQKRDKTTCLIDLDLQFGELATGLRLKPKHTITDLLAEDDIGPLLEEYLTLHETGIRLLAAPDEPADADSVDGADVARIIAEARTRFDHVIIDTPPALSEAGLAALEHADRVFLIATLDLPSVRNLNVMLNTFKQLKVPEDRIRLVLNKVEPDAGMDINRVTKYFPQGFSIVVPYGREVTKSLNMGMPVLAFAPRGEVSKALESGLSALSVADGGEPAVAPAARRRLGRGARRQKAD